MIGTLTAFSDELRRAGLPVSLTETLDAVRATEALPLAGPEVLRAALAASFVKDVTHQRAFDTVFEVFFAKAPAPAPLAEPAEPGGGGERGGGDPPGELDAASLAAALADALSGRSDLDLTRLAVLAVERFAGLEPNRPVGLSYYLYRVLRGLDLDGTVTGLLEQVRAGTIESPPELDQIEDLGLRRRLQREAVADRAQTLRHSIEAELARRLAAVRGAVPVARSLRRNLVEDIDFMHASRTDLGAMRRSLAPLARVLAARLARRRRLGRQGALDFRSTIRRSLSTGGVPVSPRFRLPRHTKPELVVLADVSGSVAAFARFTLHLVYALGSQFSAVRSFAFIDGIDEVSRIFAQSSSITEAIERVETEAAVVAADGHSDYGGAFSRFAARYLDAVTARSTVLVLGDGRGNYHPAHPEVLAALARRARRLYWLNPEPRAYWGSGDSLIAQYEPSCDAVVECRNLRQLERFVSELS